MKYGIGIDLGTTYSCLAIHNPDGTTDVITNGLGNRTTPSCVAFTEEERVVGEIAKSQQITNPKNTIIDSKRLIGQKFDSQEVQDDMKRWPFIVINDGTNKPVYEVTYKGNIVKYYPEQISSMLLEEFKLLAERHLQKDVDSVVITVPANFMNEQRKATVTAAVSAGFKNVMCLNEPTAAAIAYSIKKKIEVNTKILVYDLGGGTFDISILEIYPGNDSMLFNVLDTAGDPHLGGEDFDNLLFKHVADFFKKKYMKDVHSNPRAVSKLKSACDIAKRTLSACLLYEINIDDLMDGIDFKYKVSRALFNNICKDLFKKTIDILGQALDKEGISKSDINNVILIGGSTKIPEICKLLEDFFKIKLDITVNPDESVAMGAAIHASNIYNSTTSQKYLLNDITPYTLGIAVKSEILEETMSVLIKQGSHIPISTTKSYTIPEDYATRLSIRIFEGEDKIAVKNNLLGEFIISDITLMLAKHSDVNVTFNIDESGILNVSAIEKVSGKKNKTCVTLGLKRFSDKDMDSMVQCQKKLRLENIENEKVKKAIVGLEEFCFLIMEKIDESENKLDCSEIRKNCEEIINWLSISEDLTENIIEQKHMKIKSIAVEILK